MEKQQTLLADGLKNMQLSISEEKQQQLIEYVNLLNKWNAVYNLTALRQDEQIISRHILDSLSVLPFLTNIKTIIDIGSGGGMPGIPIAIAIPEVEITLLDSNSKKTSFLQQAIIELKLNNVTVKNERAEAFYEQKFDAVISRAFAELSSFTQLTCHMLNENSVWIAMKGVYPYEEIAHLPEYVNVNRVQPVSVYNLDAQRHIIIMSLKGNK